MISYPIKDDDDEGKDAPRFSPTYLLIWLPALNRVVITGLLLGLSAPVAAEVGGAVTFVTDAVYRGLSKSQGNPVVQFNLDYEHRSGLFGGVWVSPVNFGDHVSRHPAHWEFYPYLGYSAALNQDWRADIQASRYLYDGEIGRQRSDYNEYQVAAHFRDLASAKLYFADKGYGRGALWTYELITRYPLTDTWRVSGGLGYYDADAAFGFTDLYWHLGLSWFPFQHVALDLRYYDRALLKTHPHPEGVRDEFEYEHLENRVIFSVSLGF